MAKSILLVMLTSSIALATVQEIDSCEALFVTDGSRPYGINLSSDPNDVRLEKLVINNEMSRTAYHELHQRFWRPVRAELDQIPELSWQILSLFVNIHEVRKFGIGGYFSFHRNENIYSNLLKKYSLPKTLTDARWVRVRYEGRIIELAVSREYGVVIFHDLNGGFSLLNLTDQRITMEMADSIFKLFKAPPPSIH